TDFVYGLFSRVSAVSSDDSETGSDQISSRSSFTLPSVSTITSPSFSVSPAQASDSLEQFTPSSDSQEVKGRLICTNNEQSGALKDSTLYSPFIDFAFALTSSPSDAPSPHSLSAEPQQHASFGKPNNLIERKPKNTGRKLVFGTPGRFLTDQPELEHRLDFQLRESRYENFYVSLLTSHTSYWSNTDVAMFIMTNVFSQYGPVGVPATNKP
ncbi:unnamed protein product, partial [Protopolystoma xenopodis]